MGGTVGVTAVGMFGEGHSGWGIFPVSQVLGRMVVLVLRFRARIAKPPYGHCSGL